MIPRDWWPISPSHNDGTMIANLTISVQAEDGGSLAEDKPEETTIDKTMRGISEMGHIYTYLLSFIFYYI